MFTVIGLIIVFTFETKSFFCISQSEENTYDNNGWRPISIEKALGSLRRNFIKTSETVDDSASWNPIVRSTDNVAYFDNAIKPQDINIELANEGNYYDGVEMEEKQNVQSDADKWLDLSRNNEYSISSEVNKIEKTITSHSRQAKLIMDESLYNNIHHKNGNEKNLLNTNKREERMKIINIPNDDPNTYEVTEASEASEIKDLLENNPNKNPTPLFKPTLKPTIEQNLTNKLFNILGKYNIRINDDLTNYAASRHKYNSNYRKQSYVYPISRYNSQNHYPIDPLLAVFLSNYGHYLPGLYGFPGNYYNIYGYLASNNIHNNKPFGAYKIYSDTDSSH